MAARHRVRSRGRAPVGADPRGRARGVRAQRRAPVLPLQGGAVRRPRTARPDRDPRIPRCWPARTPTISTSSGRGSGRGSGPGSATRCSRHRSARRRCARSHGRSASRVSDKPALACLSSRVEFGIRISPELLARIDEAEAIVRALGFEVVRVRHRGASATVEVPVRRGRSAPRPSRAGRRVPRARGARLGRGRGRPERLPARRRYASVRRYVSRTRVAERHRGSMSSGHRTGLTGDDCERTAGLAPRPGRRRRSQPVARRWRPGPGGTVLVMIGPVTRDAIPAMCERARRLLEGCDAGPVVVRRRRARRTGRDHDRRARSAPADRPAPRVSGRAPEGLRGARDLLTLTGLLRGSDGGGAAVASAVESWGEPEHAGTGAPCRGRS